MPCTVSLMRCEPSSYQFLVGSHTWSSLPSELNEPLKEVVTVSQEQSVEFASNSKDTGNTACLRRAGLYRVWTPSPPRGIGHLRAPAAGACLLRPLLQDVGK